MIRSDLNLSHAPYCRRQDPQSNLKLPTFRPSKSISEIPTVANMIAGRDRPPTMGAKEVGRPSSPGIGICVVLYIHFRTVCARGVASGLEGVYCTVPYLSQHRKHHHRMVQYSTYRTAHPNNNSNNPKNTTREYCSVDGPPAILLIALTLLSLHRIRFLHSGLHVDGTHRPLTPEALIS